MTKYRISKLKISRLKFNPLQKTGSTKSRQKLDRRFLLKLDICEWVFIDKIYICVLRNFEK